MRKKIPRGRMPEKSAIVSGSRTYVVAGTPAPHEKLTILPEAIRSEWISDADITFLEADGAKCLPCKFPAAHEPVILPQSDIVLAVAG